MHGEDEHMPTLKMWSTFEDNCLGELVTGTWLMDGGQVVGFYFTRLRSANAWLVPQPQPLPPFRDVSFLGYPHSTNIKPHHPIKQGNKRPHNGFRRWRPVVSLNHDLGLQ